jgi:hypothetical protein
MNSSIVFHGIEKVIVGKASGIGLDMKCQEIVFVGLDGSRVTVTAYLPQKDIKDAPK